MVRATINGALKSSFPRGEGDADLNYEDTRNKVVIYATLMTTGAPNKTQFKVYLQKPRFFFETQITFFRVIGGYFNVN